MLSEDETVEASAVAALAGADGELKKEVMEALALGFFVAEVAMSAALRLRGVVMVRVELKVNWTA